MQNARARARRSDKPVKPFDAAVWKGKSPPVEAFEPVARLVAPMPPDWLKECLRRWGTSVMSADGVRTVQPTRASMRLMLKKIEKATTLLITAFANGAVVEFLDLGGDHALQDPGGLQSILVELRNRAVAASQSSALVDSRGRTKAGRGRAAPKPTSSAQTFCALLIAEAWRFFRGEYPAPRNRRAAEAADLLWELAGRERQPWGDDALAAWRRHFREAREDQSEEMERMRSEFRRHLRESQHQEELLRGLE